MSIMIGDDLHSASLLGRLMMASIVPEKPRFERHCFVFHACNTSNQEIL